MTPLPASLSHFAQLHPDKCAIHYRVWRRYSHSHALLISPWQSATFREFHALALAFSRGMRRAGAKPGDRVLILWLPPSQMEALAMMYGLWYADLVIVWLDPRTMPNLETLLTNIEGVEPRIILANRLVSRVIRLLVKTIKRRLRCVELIVNPKSFLSDAPEPHPPQPSPQLEGGAIVFTTGSTGTPKGVRLTSDCLARQLESYRELGHRLLSSSSSSSFVGLHSGLNFNAFDLALGNTTITLPDPENPANVLPEWIAEIDRLFRPDIMTGSRVIWENLARRRESAHQITHLKLGISGGAPVSPHLHEAIRHSIPNLRELLSAYGCTEGLPLAICGSLSSWARFPENVTMCYVHGRGVLLGEPCPGVTFRLLKLSAVEKLDSSSPPQNLPALRVWDEVNFPVTSPGEMGELVVESASLSPGYVGNLGPRADYDAKLLSSSSSSSTTPPVLLHRTGDLVMRDERGQLWMMGRLAHAVRVASSSSIIIPPVCIESMLDGTMFVERSAFVGLPSRGGEKGETPCVVIQRSNDSGLPFNPRVVKDVIRASPLWGFIADRLVVLLYNPPASHPHRQFPMDTRHNSKIKREILRDWAVKQTSSSS